MTDREVHIGSGRLGSIVGRDGRKGVMHGPGGASAREEITIGVVGARAAVQRVMSVARESGAPHWRLVAVASDGDAFGQVVKVASRIDVCLFCGPMAHDLAVREGVLPVPATYVPVDGSAIHGTLLRGILDGVLDPLRISIDSVTSSDVEHSYAEIGLDPSQVRVQPYVRAEPADFVEFHRDLYERGDTTGAITTSPQVAAELGGAGVPVLTMVPSESTVRHALHTAGLLGSEAKLDGSRIVTMIVRVPSSALPPHTGPSSYAYQEFKLALYRELLQEARPMDAAVLARDERSYLVVTTMGSLRMATDDLTVAPFITGIADELSTRVEVGIGLGRSTREAELNAQTAVDKKGSGDTGTAFLVGPADTVIEVPAQRHATGRSAVVAEGSEASRAIDVLARLASAMKDDSADESRVLDAERVAELLDVSRQTARRTMRMLVDEGLAWPMPPARPSKVGRPPQLYQLLVEKLPR